MIRSKKGLATPGAALFEGPAASTSSWHQGDARSQQHREIPSANATAQRFLNREDHTARARKYSQIVRPTVTQNEPQDGMLDHPGIVPSNAEAEPADADASLLETRANLVTAIADLFRDDKDEAVTLRELLRTGELEGQPVKMLDGSYLPIKGTNFDSGTLRVYEFDILFGLMKAC